MKPNNKTDATRSPRPQLPARKKKLSGKRNSFFKQFTFNEIFTALLLALVIVVIPTVVKLTFITPTADEAAVRAIPADGAASSVVDAFTYYKSRALLVAGSLFAIFYAACVAIGEVKYEIKKIKDPVFIASAAYISLIVLSTVLSKHRQLALTGFSDRHENVFILIVYIVIFLSVRTFVSTGRHARLVLIFFLASALFIGLIGAFQAFRRDVFSTALGNRWVLGSKYYDLYYPPGITVRFTDQVYSTLFNPNCVGLYTSLLIPVFFMSSLFCFKKPVVKILFAIGGVLLVVCSIGSKSLAGFIGLAAAVFFCAAVGFI